MVIYAVQGIARFQCAPIPMADQAFKVHASVENQMKTALHNSFIIGAAPVSRAKQPKNMMECASQCAQPTMTANEREAALKEVVKCPCAVPQMVLQVMRTPASAESLMKCLSNILPNTT
jgi:hypothetical protein